MLKFTFLLHVCFLFLIFPAASQITDDFNNASFYYPNQWYGDTVNYEIIMPVYSADGALDQTANADSLVLRSKPNVSDAVIKTESNYAYGEWRFSVADGNNWVVSSTNDYKIILMSDDSTGINLSQSNHDFNGYYLRFDGSNDDKFTLYKQTGTTSTMILDTQFPNSIDGTTPEGKTIKVKRTASGDWSVFIDQGFGINPGTQRGATVNDNTHTASSWFAIATNIANPADKRVLYFDDLYIGPVIQDTIAPAVLSYQIPDNKSMNLVFNEALDSIIATNVLNYTVNNSVGNPDSVVLDTTQAGLVHLYFSNAFVNGVQHEILIQNIADLNSNVMADTSIQFLFYELQAGDIVLNEIMPDPNPVVNLPDAEYIEIYNTTAFDIALNNWTLTVSSYDKTIPNYTMQSGEHLILCSSSDESLFQSYGNVLAMPTWSALVNSGTNISIQNEKDSIISSIVYNETWYHDDNKDDGGYSIERIDPLNNCGGYTNWTASESMDGGTPGAVNSVYSSNTDTIAPAIDQLYVSASAELTIVFTETTDSADLQFSNFTVDNGIGNPIYIEEDQNSNFTYRLNFMNSFVSETNYTLTISSLTDYCGNSASNIQENFSYYVPEQYDIVINEIMADPTPVVSLPEYDYLELYNRSDYPINLNNWKLKIGSSDRTISQSVTVESGGYIILTSDDAVNDFSAYNTAIDVIGASDLTISGKNITLSDNYNNQIHSVTYSDTWYNDNFKAEGGWSLEQIDPANSCGGSNNWTASEDVKGGTPGAINSVDDENPDNTIPGLINAYIVDTNKVQLYFDEIMDTISMSVLQSYSVDKTIGTPINANPVGPVYKSVILSFTKNFSSSVIYTLTIENNVKDCAGNEIQYQNCQFAIPDSLEPNDIIINEVLFNPLSDGVDFVEIYNNSYKVIDLSKLYIASRDLDDNVVKNSEIISPEGWLLFPESYMLVTEDPEIVKEQYYTEDEEAFIKIADLPSYSNDEGIVYLHDRWLNSVDEFYYHEDMHFDLLKDADGVSLERINFDNKTQDEENWHSAAGTVGYATPGYLNSQYLDNEEIKSEIELIPEVFSPDNDGYEDILKINYKFDESGYIANITIYDARGRQIRQLVNNKLLGTQGYISWDGINDDGAKVRLGIYLVYIEVFNLKGEVKKYKKTCVVAKKIN